MPRRRASAEEHEWHMRSLATRRAEIAAAAERGECTQRLRDRLHAAVDAAREAGVGWTAIGNALGMRSGRAYARFRRPQRPPDSDPGSP